MKSLLKYLAILCAIAILLAVAALLTLRSLYPPEKLKALAVEKLASALGREVRIGSASIGLGSLDLKNVEVSEARTFQAGTFFKADALSVRLRLLPLLRREVALGQLRLSDWQLEVVKNVDGSLNISTLGSPTPKPAVAPGSRAEPEGTMADKGIRSAVVISSLVLRNGKITYMDKASGLKARLDPVQAQWDNVRLDAPSTLALDLGYSYSAKAQAPVFGRMSFRGEINPANGELSRASLEADRLEAQYAGITVRARGKIQNFSEPKAELSLELAGLTAQDLKAFASLPSWFKLPALEGTLRMEQSGQTVHIQELELRHGKDASLLSVKGEVTLPRQANAAMALHLDVRGGPLSLGEAAGWMPESPLQGVSGTAALDLRASGTSDAPSLSGNAQVHDLNANISGQKLAGVNVEGKFTPAEINATVKGKWNNGILDLALADKGYSGARPRISLTGSLSELDLNALPQSAASGPAPASGPSAAPAAAPSSMMDTSGRFTIGRIQNPNFSAGKTELSWDLSGLTPDFSRLSGTCKFSVGPGKFDNLRLLAESSPMAKLALLPVMVLQRAASLVKIPLFPAFDQVTFSQITGDYAFKNGVMSVRESHLDSNVAYASMTGSADLHSEKLALHVSTKLGTQLGLKISGPIGFSVSGTLSNPSVRIDPASILKQPEVQKLLDQPGVNQAIEQGKKLLQNLFK